jgi:carbamoyltransferase
MKILGIHANTHESGCALMDGDRLVHAVSQERFDRQKMSEAAPLQAVRSALRATGLAADQIDCLAVSDDLGTAGYRASRRRFKRLLLRETLSAACAYYLWRPGKLWQYYRRHRFGASRRSSQKREDRLQAVKDLLRQEGFRGRIASYEHGYCHAACAYYCSGFDDALIFVTEGASFENASSVFVGRDGRIERLIDIPWPHSPGVFYATVTRLLGFRPVRHECKITGLAARGDPRVLGDYARGLFHLRDDRDDFYVSPLVHLWWWDYRDRLRRPDRPLPAPLRGRRREDIAAAWQVALEEAVVGLVRRVMRRYPDVRRVAMSGGVHGNVKLNQRINELPAVEEIYVHPGMADCGQPVGAALACWAEGNGRPRPFRHPTVYLGAEPDPHEIDRLGREYELVFEPTGDLAGAVAGLLANHRVVGVCRGPMEYGPRALGNRSILYAATDPAVNDWLNKQLRRTEFMPFAPVTLIEHAEACYVNGRKSAYTAGFMTVCYECTDYMKRTQPAVVHVDGTARPQLIARDQNPFYYDVLARYHQATGLPSVVNTSFNMHEEPIVCTAADALRAFVASNLDALVLGDRLLLKEHNDALRRRLVGVREVPQAPEDPETVAG